MTAVELPSDAEAAVATPEFEAAAIRQESRRGFLLALPSYSYLVLFFAVPLVIVVVYSFATRNRFGGTDLSGWNLASYSRLSEPIVRDILFRSLWLALLTTLICLVIAYPFAYYLATRTPVVRNLMLVFVMIPFWTNFLVRNYAWRVILGNDGPFTDVTEAIGLGEQELLFSKTAVVLGLVYSFLPFMILPQAAPRDAGGAQEPSAEPRREFRVRHPRPGGGAHDERPHGGDERRQASSGWHARRDL